ncbi:MAG: hypothetical protein WCJ09_04560 [Planctomycetota bacterium]
MIFKFARTYVVLVASVFLVAGCGPSAKVPDKAQQATISGKLTLDGTKSVPVDTSIVFSCPEKNATASGKVDALGSYSIQAGDKGVGIPAGRYKVMVRPAEPPAAQVGTDAYKNGMMQGGMTPAAKPKSDIPEKFHALDSSTISIEVKPGPNTIDLDLSKL